ncbi:hypothetical protein A3Q37_05434 [Streptomyces sp. PTY087I2]|nr:hypothetical protein A3Q37_05434 [Streptomyces sp. PTY087I2]
MPAAAASTPATVVSPPSSPRTLRPSVSTAPSARDFARQWKASSQAARHSGAYAGGTAATAASSSSDGHAGSNVVPSGSSAAMSSIRVSRVSCRRVTARCLRTSTTEAVGRFEKSLGQTSSTRCPTSAPSVTAATRSSASTYTAACRAAAPTFDASAEASIMGNDLISTTVHRPSGCTTTASGSR